jgi:hypothetical protein
MSFDLFVKAIRERVNKAEIVDVEKRSEKLEGREILLVKIWVRSHPRIT